MHKPYIWGIRLGIILFVIFSFEGGVMASRLAHTVGECSLFPGDSLSVDAGLSANTIAVVKIGISKFKAVPVNFKTPHKV